MTREEITRMAQEAGFVGFDGENKCLREFAALVAAAERAEIERLKLLCEEMLRELYVYRASEYLKDVTAAIRAKEKNG